MAFNEGEIIGKGVTKTETKTGFVYQFDLVIIETFTAQDAYKITWRGQTTSPLIQYSTIADKLGTEDIEGYVDQLAIRGDYQLSANVTLTAYSEDFTAFEKRQLAYLSNIGESLQSIIFLLQKLNE